MSTTIAILSMHTSPLSQPGTGDSGGMNVYVREISTALARQGIKCEVFTRRCNQSDPDIVEVEPGFRVHNVEAGPFETVDKAILVEYTQAFATSVSKRLDSLGITPIAFHANYWLSVVSGHILKHQYNVALISTFHTLAKVKELGGDREPAYRVKAETDAMGCSDVILANTEVEVCDLVNLYQVDPARIEVLGLGIDGVLFSPNPEVLGSRNRTGAKNALGFGTEPVIGFVGRIQRLKGVDLAIETFAALKHPTARLVVIGGPSGSEGERELERVRYLANHLKVSDRISWVEPQPHVLLSSYYRAADVFLVPSRSESFGLVALEAQSCGTPVVAANVGGLKTIIANGQSGFLIPDRDPVEWAKAVKSILDDPLLAHDMSRNALERSHDFTWAASAQRLVGIVNTLMSRSLLTCA